MLRTPHRLRSTVTGLATGTLAGACLAVGGPPALADRQDGKLTVVVNLDVNADGGYDPEVDAAQPGILVTLRDADGTEVRGTTDRYGKANLSAARLDGGSYFLTAQVPDQERASLAPAPESDSFSSVSTTVDLTHGDQTLRMAVRAKASSPTPAPAPAAEPTPGPGQPAGPAGSTAAGGVRFAVGDLVWQDLDRSGRQDPGEPAAARVSVQLLDPDGEVLDSTVTSRTGRYLFDRLPAGRYAVRFAGLPAGFRPTDPSPVTDPTHDSDADPTGTTPPFGLGVEEPGVRAATPEDGVRADYLHSGIDAGLTPVTFAVADRVWWDTDADGLDSGDEPGAPATVTLLRAADEVVAVTRTDADGRYLFAGLRPGRYRLAFSDLPAHRRLADPPSSTAKVAGTAPDPETGRTEVFELASGATGLLPAGEAPPSRADFTHVGLGAGLVSAYSVGDRAWRDDGDGVAEPGEQGLADVRVQLLDQRARVVDETVTTADGGFSFGGLPAGRYRVKFAEPPVGLVFTRWQDGSNRFVDSDVKPDGTTPSVTLDEDNPGDTSLDAGFTTLAGLEAAMAAAPHQHSAVQQSTPAPAALAPSAGWNRALPWAGAGLTAAGLGCLLAVRRRR